MPRGRIELPTSSLPMMRSTPELPRLFKAILKPLIRLAYYSSLVSRASHKTLEFRDYSRGSFCRYMWFSIGGVHPILLYMTDKKSPKMTREERLAANLRANLRRRKAVARKKVDAPHPVDNPKS